MKYLIEFLCGQKTKRDAGFFEREVFTIGFFGDLCRIVIADVGVKRGDQHQRAVKVFVHLLTVGFDTADASFVEGEDAVGQKPRGLQEIVSGDGQKDVELEVAL